MTYTVILLTFSVEKASWLFMSLYTKSAADDPAALIILFIFIPLICHTKTAF